MTFAEGLPQTGQDIRIKWGEGDWLDYGSLRTIRDIGQTPNESWLLSSTRYVNSVVRYYDQWELM
jgi:hypothetical protein